MPAIDFQSKRDAAQTAARFRTTLKGMILYQGMIHSCPAAQEYMRDCQERYAELEKISQDVEIGLCTCTWLNG